MLDGLRDLFLRAIKCKKCGEANHLVDLWNEEVESINKRFNLYYTGKREVEAPTAAVAPVIHAHNSGTDYADCDQFVCSKCGLELQGWSRIERDPDDGEEYHCEYIFKRCPECGAKMDEEIKENES